MAADRPLCGTITVTKNPPPEPVKQTAAVPSEIPL